ncbi:zinc-binding dehydrogenase [Nocardioides sp. HM23]|uniref:zinc-binding dehydrogenase n=1 Tax=Nocardioides bizhenqiangii TaxID=3095076 RepID=UPI002ACAC239|nr:zinc-binding dehydrogenase [Nocardioides sp. HM23]MDZ5620442.1 zinc-binding dehydrogenase [Nocardioides sp. HM23]
MTEIPATMRQLRSLVTPERELRLSVEAVDTPPPGEREVLVRVEAAPVNPSDLGLLLAMADVSQAVAGGSLDDPTVTAPIPEPVMRSLAARVGEAMTVGNEGAGVVVAAGASPEAEALLGHKVGFIGGATYGEYCLASPRMCLQLPEGANAVDGASSFVNPLTALGMVETMRNEGHTGLVHTAAASNLGQMLNRICLADGVPLVNIVRRPEHARLLREQGAVHVCDSNEPTFEADLVTALKNTKATLAFDAVGGGTLAGQILNAMEAAIVAPDARYSRYGSDVHKQVYVYGALDPRPIELRRRFGFAWGVGGWLLTPFLARTSSEDLVRLRQRVAAELTTTFASHYTDQISLREALDVETLQRYARQATGEKFLLRPQR